MTNTMTVKGKTWRDQTEWETVEAVEVRTCEGFGGKWALAFDANGNKYLADYNEVKEIIENASVVDEESNGLVDVQIVTFAKQPKTEDFGIYAINPEGKKVYFKMSKITSFKYSKKSDVKRVLMSNGYKSLKVLTEDEDKAWDSFMSLGFNLSSIENWKFFRKAYKTGFCRKWTGNEWVSTL